MSDQNEDITPTGPGWKPVEEITAETIAARKKRDMQLNIAAGVIFFGGVFLAAKYGSRAGTRSALKSVVKDMQSAANDAYFNAGVTADNVKATIHNGEIILDAIAKAQPAIDAINAVTKAR